MSSRLDTQSLALFHIEETLNELIMSIAVVLCEFLRNNTRKKKRNSNPTSYRMIPKIPAQVNYLKRMVEVSDVDCINNLRMDRNTFGRLCTILRQLGGLSDGRYVTVEEQVAIFVGILAHHNKNSVAKFNFRRSGQTISAYVHLVLRAIMKLHNIFLVKPHPIGEDCNDTRWKWFKGCLGALDGTYISMLVPSTAKPRYRTRKGQIATNVLAACDTNLRFVYVLAGWEGSAADGRVLRDAVTRVNGLKVPRGSYFLCDNGYANSEGFLTPYKGVRYHLKEWGPETSQPQNPEEMFNMRHTKARNVIERAFRVMKMRWGILRSATYYPVKVQNRLIMSCFLLHNFIRQEMLVDPIEQLMENFDVQVGNDGHHEEEEFVDVVEPSTDWNKKRDFMANEMWHAYN